MNILDENVRNDQRALLRNWRIPFRQIGNEISRSGIQDADILPVLNRLKRPTFFTHDQDFFESNLCSPRYCIVWLDVLNADVAMYLRRFLHHPAFDTFSKRMGKVVRVRPERISYWEGKRKMQSIAWFLGSP
jgi:hypothetical protein